MAGYAYRGSQPIVQEVPKPPRERTYEVIFGERMREARTQAGLSQEAVGDRAGMNQSMIAKRERGMTYTRVSQIFDLARALDVSVVWLLTGGV